MPTHLQRLWHDVRPARTPTTVVAGDDRGASARSAGDRATSPIAGALAALTWSDLQRLVAASDALLTELGGLDAWIALLADWELNRRAGLRHSIEPPPVTIPHELRVASVVAVTMLRDAYAESAGPDCARVVALLDAIIALLPAREPLQCDPRRFRPQGANGKRARAGRTLRP